MVNSTVLVLNQNYEPLNVCRVRRAVVLLYQGKAELVENGMGEVHSIAETIPLPSVIRLIYLIKRPPAHRKLSRLEIFNRDRFTCQYCGSTNRELTLDHVLPRNQGGKHSWDNLVSACIPCNRRKAGRTPEQASMALVKPPRKPPARGFLVPYIYLRRHQEWNKYLGQAG